MNGKIIRLALTRSLSIPIIGVTLTIVLQLLAALILDYSSKSFDFFTIRTFQLLSLVFIIQSLRLVVWGVVHQHNPVSNSYPFISLFFPMIYIISIIKQEASFEYTKIVGLMLIVIGIIIINKQSQPV